jgi:hypothetical protein
MLFAHALLTVSLFTQIPYSDLPRLTVVTLETLVADYRPYDNREIVIAGIVTAGPEGSMMYLPVPSPPGQAHAMFVTVPLNVSRTGGRLEREFLERQNKAGSITAILRGRFHGADRPRFEYQSCCEFMFEITKVLSVG